MLGVAYARDIAEWVVVRGGYGDEDSQKAAVMALNFFISLVYAQVPN
jgi:hypothetical protein